MFGQFFVDPEADEPEELLGAGGVALDPVAVELFDPPDVLDGVVVEELVAASATRAPPVIESAGQCADGENTTKSD